MEGPPTKFALLSRWGLVGLALFPCLTSLGFHVVGPKPQASSQGTERPALAFDQYAVNLGPITPMGTARARFRFTNLSDRPVKILNLKPSCGCLKPRLDKRNFAPGETGQFFVQVSTAGEQPGPRAYTIEVEYEDPEPQKTLLTFRMELPPRQVYITPRAVLVYVFDENTTEKEITVTDNRLNPITITGVDSPAKFITAAVAETKTEDGVQKSRIAVKVLPVPMGRHNTYVRVHTDDPKFPVLSVPVIVHRHSPDVQMPKSAKKPTQGSAAPEKL